MTSMPSQIENIVYVMLENRSFDHIFGSLTYDGTPNFIGKPGPFNAGPNPSDSKNVYNGLTYPQGVVTDPEECQPYKAPNPCCIPCPTDPQHDFEDVTKQIFGADGQGPATMEGFVQNYAESAGASACDLWQAMSGYNEKELSVLIGLGKHFGLSDLWFSSIPSQTFCNRAFSICGNSQGRVNNSARQFDTPTIWKILSEHADEKYRYDWKIYYQEGYPIAYTPEPGQPHPISKSHIPSSGQHSAGYYFERQPGYSFTEAFFKDNIPNQPSNPNYPAFEPIQNFYNALTSGTLPRFSYLEPAWEGFRGLNPPGETWYQAANSYHSPADVGPGEQFLFRLFESLSTSSYWDSTLLIITFDEHGGIYDHVPPPSNAQQPKASEFGNPSPWGNPYGFDFTRFGVRVPAILVSPYVAPQTVFRPPEGTETPFDHTSVLATLLKWSGIEDSTLMGSRVAAAPTFETAIGTELHPTPNIQLGGCQLEQTTANPITDLDPRPPAEPPESPQRSPAGT